MICFCKTTASATLWLYLKRLYFISSAIAYCISPYVSFCAGLSCYLIHSKSNLHHSLLQLPNSRCLSYLEFTTFTVCRYYKNFKNSQATYNDVVMSIMNSAAEQNGGFKINDRIVWQHESEITSSSVKSLFIIHVQLQAKIMDKCNVPSLAHNLIK